MQNNKKYAARAGKCKAKQPERGGLAHVQGGHGGKIAEDLRRPALRANAWHRLLPFRARGTPAHRG